MFTKTSNRLGKELDKQSSTVFKKDVIPGFSLAQSGVPPQFIESEDVDNSLTDDIITSVCSLIDCCSWPSATGLLEVYLSEKSKDWTTKQLMSMIILLSNIQKNFHCFDSENMHEVFKWISENEQCRQILTNCEILDRLSIALGCFGMFHFEKTVMEDRVYDSIARVHKYVADLPKEKYHRMRAKKIAAKLAIVKRHYIVFSQVRCHPVGFRLVEEEQAEHDCRLDQPMKRYRTICRANSIAQEHINVYQKNIMAMVTIPCEWLTQLNITRCTVPVIGEVRLRTRPSKFTLRNLKKISQIIPVTFDWTDIDMKISEGRSTKQLLITDCPELINYIKNSNRVVWDISQKYSCWSYNFVSGFSDYVASLIARYGLLNYEDMIRRELEIVNRQYRHIINADHCRF